MAKKNGPLQAGFMRQTRGSEAGGNGKAVPKMNQYRESFGPSTGRTAAASPAPLPKPQNVPGAGVSAAPPAPKAPRPKGVSMAGMPGSKC